MSAVDIVQKVKARLYGTGVGEKPTIVLGAADASESIAARTIAFDVADGTQVQAGDVLSIVDAADADSAFLLYVTGVATNTVTALMGYLGAPSPDTADDLDGAVFELNALKSEWMMWQNVEAVINTLLYPQVYKYSTTTITPDLSALQSEIAAVVMEVQDVQQYIGNRYESIPFSLARDLHTTVSSTGSLLEYGAYDGSTLYVTTKERYLATDTLPAAVEDCIATGAAALTLGASRSSTDLEAASKDSQFRGQRNPADQLWRDFITLRSSINEDLASQVDWFEFRR